MDKRVLSGSDPESLEAELKEQFRGLEVLVWRVQGADGETSVHAVPFHQLYEFIEEIALKLCKVIDRHAGVRVQPDRQEHAEIMVNIRSLEPAAFIGWHGQTLDAIELVLNAIVYHRVGMPLRLTVDVDQYRQKRTSYLDALVRRTVMEIEQDHRERPLTGLLSKERRHVHTVLAHHPYLTTESRGRGPRRTLYIMPRPDLAALGEKDGR